MKYFIQISEQCTNYFEECFWDEGLHAFINPDKVDISELKQISEDMWSKYYKNKTNGGYVSSNPLTTIAIIDGDEIKILYSTKSFDTEPEELGEILDTLPHNDDLGAFECYRNDYSSDDSGSDNSDSDNSGEEAEAQLTHCEEEEVAEAPVPEARDEELCQRRSTVMTCNVCGEQYVSSRRDPTCVGCRIKSAGLGTADAGGNNDGFDYDTWCTDGTTL
jgi:hypothetical protein